jgi:hypothetical protein
MTQPKKPVSGALAEDSDLVSSARDQSGAHPPSNRGAGSISLISNRVGEELARAVLDRAFADAGLRIQNDYPFRSGTTMLQLDGFDPVAKVGYQYVSHADADVVTDFDTAAELAMRELDGAGKIRLLIIHDGDVGDVEELAARAREFISGLDRTQPG